MLKESAKQLQVIRCGTMKKRIIACKKILREKSIQPSITAQNKIRSHPGYRVELQVRFFPSVGVQALSVSPTKSGRGEPQNSSESGRLSNPNAR